jgi:hypothetical protein
MRREILWVLISSAHWFLDLLCSSACVYTRINRAEIAAAAVEAAQIQPIAKDMKIVKIF